MLVHHLLSGMVIGVLAAVASLLQGHSVPAAIGFYVLGANIGFGASVLGALSCRLATPGRLRSIPH